MARIVGTNGRDILKGKAGKDTILGRDGNDDLIGLGGNDILKGGKGNDKLLGGNGNDILRGEAGNDFIWGGRGDDKMYGGTGKDKFYFEPGSGRDKIYDFKHGQDKIYIDRDYGFTKAEILMNSSSSGGDSAIDLSGVGADSPRIILFDLDLVRASDIILF